MYCGSNSFIATYHQIVTDVTSHDTILACDKYHSLTMRIIPSDARTLPDCGGVAQVDGIVPEP